MLWSCVSGAFGAVMLGGVVVPAMTIFVFSCRSGPTSFFGDVFRGGARAYAQRVDALDTGWKGIVFPFLVPETWLLSEHPTPHCDVCLSACLRGSLS